jgi:hypothetical protein
MTPKEKAVDLFQKYYNNYGYYGIPVDAVKNSKKLALIAVEELIEEENYREGNAGFWQEVKKEIELL